MRWGVGVQWREDGTRMWLLCLFRIRRAHQESEHAEHIEDGSQASHCQRQKLQIPMKKKNKN